MAQDIVGGLFGIQQAPDYAAQDYRNAMALAEMNNPNAQGRFLGAMVGAPLGRALGQGVGSLLGVEDPRLQQASVIREAQQQGFDVTSPEGLQQLAQFFVQRGQPGLASQVAQQIQGMQQTALTQKQTQLGIEEKERGIKNREGLQAALANMPENVDRATFIKAILPYVDSSAEAIRLASSRYGFDAEEEKMATKELDPGDGLPYIVGTDKVGRIQLSNNRVIPRASFDTAKAAYDAEDTMLTLLSDITKDDIENAYGASMDYTEVPYAGRLVPETTSAQQKVKGAKIQETLRTLGPLKGATSDKEFSAIMSGFPSFDKDPEVMAKWIEDAKKYIRKRMQKGVKEFGFDRSQNLGTPEPKQQANTSGAWDAAKEERYQAWKRSQQGQR